MPDAIVFVARVLCSALLTVFIAAGLTALLVVWSIGVVMIWGL